MTAAECICSSNQTARSAGVWTIAAGDAVKTAAFGVYPEVTLQAARDKRHELRKQLKAGADPSAVVRERRILRDAATGSDFETVAREWQKKNAPDWSAKYREQVLSVLERDFFPDLGRLSMEEITPRILIKTLGKIEARGALDALSDARSIASRVFRYAIATDRAQINPAADLHDAFRRHKKGHHAFLIPPALPAFLRTLNGCNTGGMGVLGLKLILLTLVRTTELRAAPWAEFDLDKAEWHIPAERMKLRRPHIVPLSRQAVALLRDWRARQPKGETYVFPNQQARKHPFMSENTMLKIIAHLGYQEKTTVHGLRSTGSTILHESGRFTSLVIERQLAHVDENEVRGAYNHAEYLPQRREMMQWWADYLESAMTKA
jgi:integrase